MSADETLATRLAESARGDGVVTFVDLRERETRLSHAVIHARAAQAAAALAARGIRPGDRVAIVAATSPEFFDGFFGCVLAGAVPVPLYPPVRLGRLDEYHERTAAMMQAARVALVLADRRTQRVLGRTLEQARPALGCERLDALHGRESLDLESDLEPDALGFIQFSSGTTRRPHPVAVTHRQILANVDAIGGAVLGAHPESASFRHVAASWLPLYHDMGLVGGLFTSLLHGRDLVLIPPELFLARPALWLRAISRHRATISPAPNFAYALCVDRVADAELEGVDLSSWRVAMNGAEPVAPRTLERFLSRFAAYGLRPEALTPVYGLSEATLAVTFSRLDERFSVRRFDADALVDAGRAVEVGASASTRSLAIVSCGPPLPGFAIEIRDAAGEARSEGELGRVFVRGPSLMTGYDGLPEETKAVLRDGWLDTGDVGFLYEGELHLHGRAKDLVVLRGRNHAPQELERALDDLPGVRPGCSAAVGHVDEEGEALWLFVERARDAGADAQDAALEEAVRRRALERSGLRAQRVVVLDPGTLPRTSSGKIRRAETLRLFERGELVPPAPVNAPRLAVEMLRSWRATRRAGR